MCSKCQFLWLVNNSTPWVNFWQSKTILRIKHLAIWASQFYSTHNQPLILSVIEHFFHSYQQMPPVEWMPKFKPTNFNHQFNHQFNHHLNHHSHLTCHHIFPSKSNQRAFPSFTFSNTGQVFQLLFTITCHCNLVICKSSGDELRIFNALLFGNAEK